MTTDASPLARLVITPLDETSAEAQFRAASELHSLLRECGVRVMPDDQVERPPDGSKGPGLQDALTVIVDGLPAAAATHALGSLLRQWLRNKGARRVTIEQGGTKVVIEGSMSDAELERINQLWKTLRAKK